MESQTISGEHIESILAYSVMEVSVFKESFFVFVSSCVGEIIVLTSLQWTSAAPSISAPMVSLLLQAMKAIMAIAMYSATKTDEGILKIFNGECFIILIATTCDDYIFENVVRLNGCGIEIIPAFGVMRFCSSHVLVCTSVSECLDILDVVDADDGLVAHEFLGLFHEPLDAPVLVGDGNAEVSGILHLVGVQHIFAFARESLEVRVEQGVAEYDEQGFVVACVGEREAYCLPQTLRVVLEYGAGLAPFRLVLQVAVHGFGLVAGNEDCLGGGEGAGVVTIQSMMVFPPTGSRHLGRLLV